MSKLRNFIHKQRTHRINKDLASLIVIDGQMGTGKTTLAIRFLEEYQKRKAIDYKTQYAVGSKEFQEKLELCIEKGKEVIIYDEAGDFSKKTTLSKLNRTIDKIFQIYRTFNILVIMVLPSFTDLDKGIYKRGVVRALFNCHLALIEREEEGEKVKELKKGFVRGYSLRRVFYMFEYIKKYSPAVEQIVYTKGTTPNLKTRFHNLPKEREEELKEISKIQKKAQLIEQNNREGFNPKPYVKEVLKEPKKYMSKVGSKFNASLIRAYLSLNEQQARMVRAVAEKEFSQ